MFNIRHVRRDALLALLRFCDRRQRQLAFFFLDKLVIRDALIGFAFVI